MSGQIRVQDIFFPLKQVFLPAVGWGLPWTGGQAMNGSFSKSLKTGLLPSVNRCPLTMPHRENSTSNSEYNTSGCIVKMVAPVPSDAYGAPDYQLWIFASTATLRTNLRSDYTHEASCVDVCSLIGTNLRQNSLEIFSSLVRSNIVNLRGQLEWQVSDPNKKVFRGHWLGRKKGGQAHVQHEQHFTQNKYTFDSF